MKARSYSRAEFSEDQEHCVIQQAPSAPTGDEAPYSPPADSTSFISLDSRAFYTMAFAILGALDGVGVALIVVAAVGKLLSRNQLVWGSTPILIIGAVLGSIAGLLLVSFLCLPRSFSAHREIERKLFGPFRTGVYSGVPAFCLISISTAFEPLMKEFGIAAGAYAALGVLLVVIASALYWFDRLPRRLIIPLGLMGWLAFFAFVCWFGWIGPGGAIYHRS